jgi:hypothetical protein
VACLIRVFYLKSTDVIFFDLHEKLYHNSLPRFLLANTQSIQNKIDELEAIVVNNSIDIACITESWLNDDGRHPTGEPIWIYYVIGATAKTGDVVVV